LMFKIGSFNLNWYFVTKFSPPARHIYAVHRKTGEEHEIFSYSGYGSYDRVFVGETHVYTWNEPEEMIVNFATKNPLLLKKDGGIEPLPKPDKYVYGAFRVDGRTFVVASNKWVVSPGTLYEVTDGKVRKLGGKFLFPIKVFRYKGKNYIVGLDGTYEIGDELKLVGKLKEKEVRGDETWWLARGWYPCPAFFVEYEGRKGNSVWHGKFIGVAEDFDIKPITKRENVHYSPLVSGYSTFAEVYKPGVARNYLFKVENGKLYFATVDRMWVKGTVQKTSLLNVINGKVYDVDLNEVKVENWKEVGPCSEPSEQTNTKVWVPLVPLAIGGTAVLALMYLAWRGRK